MKVIKLSLVSVISFIVGMVSVYAAPSASISVGSASIENGSSVKATLTLKETAAWNIKINGTGNTSGCSLADADATSNGKNTTKTFTVTCKATSIGTINFSYSGDITSADGTNTKISGSKSVKVTVPREKSNDANLKSISVEGYELSPAFDSNTLEYYLTVNNDVTLLKITATKSSSYASIKGIGEIGVSEGENILEITVTSETGVQKKYTIYVTVEDKNPIEVLVEGKSYTVVKKIEYLEKPQNYEETTVTINEIEIPAFSSELVGFTLVGLKDENGVTSLFIYNENDNSYTKYVEYSFSGVLLYFSETKEIPKGYEKCNIEINDEEVNAYCKTGDKDFVLLYGLNINTGNKGFYVYDKLENTLQRFNEILMEELDNKSNIYLLTTIIFGGAFVALLLLFIVVISKRKKNRRKKLVNELM